MTVNAPLADPNLASDAVHIAQIASRRDWKTWLITVLVVLCIFILLQNRYWVPGGDSEVYTTIARNLASGKGYTFNGQPVSMVPPGWSMVMAGVMKISLQFLVLKLIAMSCMLGSLAISYWICRRFASPQLSAAVILLSAILSHIYSLTIWLHSDSLFCLLSSVSLLLAFQINEGRPIVWRAIVLIVLCAAAVTVRWAGLLNWLLVGAVLLNGELWPRINRRWVLMIVTGIVVLGTLLTLRAVLTVPPEVQKLIKDFGGTGEDTAGTIVERADKTLAVSYPWISQTKGVAGYFARGGLWGNWFSYLLWQPFRLSNALLGIISLALGWTIIGLLVMQAWLGAKSRMWLWLAILIYTLGLALNWSHPTPRYFVPIAPLIILGIFKGLELLSGFWTTQKTRWIPAFLLQCFLISYLACNAALYAVDVYVARSKNFYDVYEAGMDKDLIYACHWLNDNPPGDGQIVVSELYINMGHPHISRFGLRATTMLTGKAIVSLPLRYTRSGGDPRKNPVFLNWARVIGIKYLLYQPEVSPWRVFHFRMGWLQELITHQPPIDTGAGWRLYRIPPTGDEAIRISVDAYEDWPTRVPGM